MLCHWGDTRGQREWMCNNCILRRCAELGIHLRIRTTLESLLHFSNRRDHIGISKAVEDCVVKKKHITWKNFEVKKGRVIWDILVVPYFEWKRNLRAYLCERRRLRWNSTTLHGIWVGYISTSMRYEIKCDTCGDHTDTETNHTHKRALRKKSSQTVYMWSDNVRQWAWTHSVA